MPTAKFTITKISLYFETRICQRCRETFTITDEKHKRRRLCEKCRKEKK